LTGKSLTNLSMPVHIFAPTYLERAVKLEANDFVGRLKEVSLF